MTTDPRGIPQLARDRAAKLGLSIYMSKNRGKRFYIIHGGKRIHFGAKYAQTFADHGDSIKRRNWRARHREILVAGRPAYLSKSSPEYYAWHLLW